MGVTSVIVVVVALIVLIACAFYISRAGDYGQVVQFQRLPDGHLRRGRLKYTDTSADFYRVPSFVPTPHYSLDRVNLEVIDRSTGHPGSFSTVLVVRSGDREFSIGFRAAGEMAFTSWLESAFSTRQVSLDRDAFKRFISQADN